MWGYPLQYIGHTAHLVSLLLVTSVTCLLHCGKWTQDRFSHTFYIVFNASIIGRHDPIVDDWSPLGQLLVTSALYITCFAIRDFLNFWVGDAVSSPSHLISVTSAPS